MTDPEFAHRTYIEPITPEVVEKIIIREKPDALLPTLGGQTALNTSMALFKSGVLDKHDVRMIGAKAEAIDKGEDRQLFKEAMIKIGLDMPRSGIAHTMEEAQEGGRGNRHASRSSSAPPSPSAARAAASPTTARNSRKSSPAASISRRSPKSSSRNPCSAGRNSKWRSCATAPTTASSSARSKTSIPWASTPATRSPSRRSRRSPTANTRSCATPRSPCIREIGVETGGSNIQFATDPEDRPHDRHRDEPARLPLVRARLEGHRFPDRQDRRQTRRRLHARRTAERHHPRDARLVRADHRLRGHQDPALHLREIPDRRIRC